VIILTATISLGVVWVTGSALNSRLTDGIRQVNLNSAFIEARSTIYTAQYRLLFAENESNKQIQKIIDDVVSSATTFTSNENAREVVFLSSPGKKSSKNYEIASNNLEPSTIPNSLRTEVQASVTPISAYTQMKYVEGQKIPGVAVGQKITIPKAGSYEMYLIFSLASEKETLDLIDRFLLFAGILLETTIIGACRAITVIGAKSFSGV
jgi:two-component system sensor histidine kinase MtrB